MDFFSKANRDFNEENGLELWAGLMEGTLAGVAFTRDVYAAGVVDLDHQNLIALLESLSLWTTCQLNEVVQLFLSEAQFLFIKLTVHSIQLC